MLTALSALFLRRPAAQYTGQLGDLLVPLAEVMRRTMHAAPGVGLAAPQVGIGLALKRSSCPIPRAVAGSCCELLEIPSPTGLVAL